MGVLSSWVTHLWKTAFHGWNDLALAASHTSEDEAFYAFSSGIEEGGLCPKTSNWMDDLAGSRQQDRGGPSKY